MLNWPAVTVLGAVAFCAATAALGVAAFAIVSERSHRRRRRGLSHMARSPAADIAYRAVVNARAAFTRSVQAYEEALASAGAVASSSNVLAGEPQTTAADIQVMEQRKDSRRVRLFDAQRRWESVRPGSEPESDVDMWVGAGELHGWSLGLIGHETALLRIEHAIDSGCWVVVETRRFRFGPAFGAEHLHLGIVIEGAKTTQLTDLVQAAMGSPEVAVRLGTSVGRIVSRRRTTGRQLHDSLRTEAAGGSRLFVKGISSQSRRLVLAHLATERGIELNHTSDGVSPRFERLALRITSSGPALLVGAWFGRRPSARIVAASNHQAWLRSRSR